MPALTPVESRHISVVIQGPLFRGTKSGRNIFACISSVRKHLPDAQVIVSTWNHEDTSDIPADLIVAGEDPGHFLDTSGNQINLNRMLYSTLAGIQTATRPYVMKLRADHSLTSAALAVIGSAGPAGMGEPRLFDTPITVTTLYIRNPERVPMLFHISDLVQFGTRDAMLALWDQPLFEQQDILRHRPFRNPFGNFCGYSSAIKVAEQALMLGAMSKKGIDADLAHPCQVRIENLKLWDSILTSEFRALDYSKAGVDFPERFLGSPRALTTLYRASDIDQMSYPGAYGYRLRIARIWFNQFVLSLLRPGWWVSLASFILFSCSPSIARTARSFWRKFRKVAHPDSYRI